MSAGNLSARVRSGLLSQSIELYLWPEQHGAYIAIPARIVRSELAPGVHCVNTLRIVVTNKS